MTLNKRGKISLLLVLIVLIILIINIFIPKNYKKIYKVNNYKIKESYIKKDKMYIFSIFNNSNSFETISLKKYTTKRKLITKINEYKNDDTTCIVIQSDKIINNILCNKNGEKIDYHLTSFLPKKYYKTNQTNKNEFENIETNINDESIYFVWNYTGFYKLSKDKFETIKLFKNDTYNIDLITIINKYLIIADYDQKYNYNKLYKINIKNNKVDTIELNEDISFDSRIIGTNKNSVYILDEKNKREYEVNIKKKEINKIGNNKMGRILKNGQWEKMKINKIITDNISFDDNNYITYKKDVGLYMYQKNISKPTKVSNKDVKNIVYGDDEKVYYITDETLYKYSFEYGEEKVLDYFELNFNYENMIIIYNNMT